MLSVKKSLKMLIILSVSSGNAPNDVWIAKPSNAETRIAAIAVFIRGFSIPNA